jgi:hypothetical protein
VEQTMVFDDSHEALVKLFDLHPKGVKFLCPQCGVELLVILSMAEAHEKQKHPGVYCTTNPEHVFRMFNLTGQPREDRKGPQ